MSNLHLAIQLFLQLTVILAVCRLVGWLGRRFLGQTQVVMEMVAGVLLGPSFFGLLAPRLQTWLFPRKSVLETAAGNVEVQHPSMMILFVLAQLGLVLYMFLIGLEFDAGLMRGRVRSVTLISGTGIVVPFVLGGVAAIWLLGRGDLFGPGVSPFSAVLYLGASVSITAFPMLARILYERRLAGTPLGTVTLASGSLDDAIAWCLLALVLATLQNSPQQALLTIGGGALYAVLLFGVGRPLLRRFADGVSSEESLSVERYTLVLLVLMSCALVTDVIGIYAVFGAFLAGAAMPRGPFARAVAARTELLTTSLLLPIFFVYSGLNTKIGLVNTPVLWMITAAIILLAILGKGVACAVAARIGGETWRNAAIIGTLMNARGLMELIILNVGLEHGVITPTLFTIMVLMAVATTLMASPLYTLLSRNLAEEPGVLTAPGARTAEG